MTLRVGIVGCGFIGYLHSLALKGMVGAGLVDAAVVATCDHDAQRARAFARAHRADIATDDVDRLVDSVDAVWVCTPTSSHLRVVAAAADAGRAIFCEKPVGRTLAEAVAVVERAEAAAVPSQVGLVLRRAPVFVALRDLVRSGRLGRPMSVVFRDDQYFPDQGQYASRWRTDRETAGGGTLLEHSIHDLDLLQWTFGEVAHVTGTTSNFAGHEGIEDVAVATLRFASGATAALASVWHQMLSRPSTRRVEVLCERGLAWLENDHTGPLRVETDDGHEATPCPPPSWVAELALADDRLRSYAAPYAPADRAFLDAVAASEQPAPALREALAAHRLAEAVYRSAAVGTPLGNALLT